MYVWDGGGDSFVKHVSTGPTTYNRKAGLEGTMPGCVFIPSLGLDPHSFGGWSLFVVAVPSTEPSTASSREFALVQVVTMFDLHKVVAHTRCARERALSTARASLHHCLVPT